MTKILSIIFVPIIFFLFYFSVIFLTYTTKPEKDKLNTDLVSNTDYKLGDSSSGKQNFSNENLEIIDQEKHSKIILPLNSLETAKKLCEFSKRNNINCIILNL